MRTLLFGFALIFCGVANAQWEPPKTVPLAPDLKSELQQLQQAALKSDYAFNQVQHLSDSIGPRISGSPQAQAAVEYVASELRKLGLEVRLEKVMVPHWVRGVETGELVQYPGQAPGTTQKLLLTALGPSVATPPQGITAEVVVAESFDELRALGRDQVAGKIVVFHEPFDHQMAAIGFGLSAYEQAVEYRGRGASEAAKLGAVASLIRSAGNADYRVTHTGAMSYADGAPKIPAGALAAEDADLIARLAKQGPVRMHLTLTPQTLPDAVSYNVIADIKGSQHPEQVVIVSGHLDSWDLGTGAIDDAAGVGVAMEVANLVHQLKLKPKRTLRIVAWMNEENGLKGGFGYAADHKAELGNLVAAIESDLGAGHPVGINFKGKEEALPLLRPIAEILQGSRAGILRLNDDTGSDIWPLSQAGVPTLSPIQDARAYFDYHHTAADTFDKILPQELRENAAVMAVLGYALANLPTPLPR